MVVLKITSFIILFDVKAYVALSFALASLALSSVKPLAFPAAVFPVLS